MRAINEFEAAVLAVIKKYAMISPGTRVLAGVSGGADSRCLLEVLLSLREKLNFTVTVVHVDHGIRKTSGEDAEAVRVLCGDRGVPVQIYRIENIKKQAPGGASVEEGARILRYGFFAECMKRFGADSLALAHNMDDQAETVLFKLFRGAGLKGLAGIHPVNELTILKGEQPVRVIRPLLFTPRSDIEAYLAAKSIDDIRIDETNDTDDYARNRIRHHIVPEAKRSVNACASEHVADAAEHVREALDFINAEALRRFENVKTGKGELDVILLNDEPEMMRREIMLLALKEAGMDQQIGKEHVKALLDILRNTDGTKVVKLPGGRFAARRYDRLVFNGSFKELSAGSPEVLPPAEIPIKLRGAGEETRYFLPGLGTVVLRVFERPEGNIGEKIPVEAFTKWFDFDKMKGLVCFRTRRQGDWIDVGAARKKLGREMIDLKIPADDRDTVWLLADDSEIIWIVGSRRSQSRLVGKDTKFILEAQLCPNG